MEIVLVAALDRDGVIGRDGGLPWHLPADLGRFKAATLGKPVIMGRKTCDSLPKPLPGRRNIVLTRQPGFSRPGFETARDADEALALAASAPEVMVIGGAEVYALFLPRARRMLLTEVQAGVGGDTRFPPFDASEWVETARELRPADERNAYALVFRELRRR